MAVMKQIVNKQEQVYCPECGLQIGLRNAYLNGSTGLAYFDPYNKRMYAFEKGKGCYVHYNCLSEKRKQEILQSIKA